MQMGEHWRKGCKMQSTPKLGGGLVHTKFMQIKGKYCHHKKITITEESEYSLLTGDEFLWQRVVGKLPMSHNYIIHDDWQTIKYDTDGSKPATQPDTSYGHLMPYPVISFTACSTVLPKGLIGQLVCWNERGVWGECNGI